MALDGVTKIFHGPNGQIICAVNCANLGIADKELLALVGPSGCGKTTTLRLVACLEDPTEGTISFDGDGVNDVPPKDRDGAMVIQNHALYPHMTARQNLAFGLKLRKLPPPEIENRVRLVRCLSADSARSQ